MLISSLFSYIVSTSVSTRQDKTILYSRTSIIIVLYSLYIAYSSLYLGYFDQGIGLFNGLFHLTIIGQNINVFLFIITIAILALTSFYPKKLLINKIVDFKLLSALISKKHEQFNIVEYTLIIIFIILGAIFLISTSDLVSVFLSIELQSYGLYLLATIYRNSEKSASAGLMYFLLGGLSSCFILLGIALLYINSGVTNMDNIFIITNLSSDNLLFSYKSDYINYSLLMLSIGFLFKVAAAPFHFWSPDVYDAIPTVVTTFVAIIPKISIFIFLLEIINYTSDFIFINQYNWTYSLVISSFLSLIIGTVLGLSQLRIKRLFAYSTISHVGFILLALAINTTESIQAYIFYIMQYSLSNLNGFIILFSIGWFIIYQTPNGDYFSHEKKNSPLQLISQLKGLYKSNSMLAISLSISIFSFVGIPPLIGFFAKQMVLSSAIEEGFIFISLIAILTSVISASYYLNIIKQIYFDNSNDLDSGIVYKVYSNKLNTTISSHLSIIISVLTIIILIFILMPNEFLSITNIMSLSLLNT